MGPYLAAGLAWQPTKSLAIFGEYRHTSFDVDFDTTNSIILPTANGRVETTIRSDRLLFGISYRFGADAPAKEASTMKAVLMSGLGGIEILHIAEHPDPVMKEDELLVRVRATALNRADLLQRRGKHPPPKGVPDILGLEMAGEVVSAGAACAGWAPGDRVCALLPGAGYAELVAIPAGLAMRIPETSPSSRPRRSRRCS